MSADSIAGWTLAGYFGCAVLLVVWRALACPEGWRLWMLHVIAVVYCKFGYHWRANRPCPFLDAHPGIVIANHRSPVDPMLIWAGVSNCRPIEFLTAGEYFGTPGLQFILDAQRSIPVARDGKDMSATRLALRRVQQGRLVGVFPEGRINKGIGMLPANPGIGWLALQSRAPVFPVFVVNAPQGESMVAPFFNFTRVRVIYGDPIDLSAYYGQRRTPELLQEVTDLMMTRLGALGGIPAVQSLPMRDAARSDVLPMTASSA
jgi:1-acyl-sn-glycerol-3-phosphate acyltransferase